jgi:hypothetical protein
MMIVIQSRKTNLPFDAPGSQYIINEHFVDFYKNNPRFLEQTLGPGSGSFFCQREQRPMISALAEK